MKVVVCGAGSAGLAPAVRPDAHGAEAVVLEKAAGPRTQGYEAAEAIGILPRLREVAYDIDERGRLQAAADWQRSPDTTRAGGPS